VVTILACGPRAVRAQKALIAAWEKLPLRDAIARGIDSFAASWDSDEPARMMGEFLEAMRRRKLAVDGRSG
jgi:enoyl-CoA hydratase